MFESRIGCRISKIDAFALKILTTKEPFSSLTLILKKICEIVLQLKLKETDSFNDSNFKILKWIWSSTSHNMVIALALVSNVNFYNAKK